MDDDKLMKLPKWARLEIFTLESNLKRAEKELSTLYGNHQTNTSIALLSKNKPLPNYCTIYFDIGNDVISCNIVDDELRIYGRKQISVFPRASNSIYIK